LKQLIFTIIGLAVLLPANADENNVSISLGEKSIRTEFEYDIGFNDNATVTSIATGIFANISYYQTPSVSYALEFVAFTNASSSGIYSSSPTTTIGYEVTVKPNQYLSWQAQYTFLPSKAVRPIVLGGVSYLKADVTAESVIETNTTRTVTGSATKSDSSFGLIYGIGLDINFYKNVSFVLDYRIRPDIVDNSVDEINGSLKYQF